MHSSLQLLYTLSKRDLQQRYQATMLGKLWLVLQPLLMLLVYAFVFGHVLNIRFDQASNTNNIQFAFYVMAGLIAFNSVADALTRATTCLTDNRQLLLNSDLPVWVLPAVPVLVSLFLEALMILVFLIVIAVIEQHWLSSFWFIPILLLIRGCFSLALAYLFSVFNVFVRDIAQALPMMLMGLMLLSPVFYPVSQVPEPFQAFYFWNILTHLLEAYRQVLLEGQVDVWMLAGLLGVASMTLLVSWSVFKTLLPQARYVL